MFPGTFAHKSSITLLALAMYALVLTSGCAKMNSEQVTYSFKTPALESQLSAYGKILQDNGLSSAEVTVILERARTEANNFSLQIASDSLSPASRNILSLVTGSMKALGKSSFGSSQERKILAMQLIARSAIESGAGDLEFITESEIQNLFSYLAQGQVVSSTYAGLSSSALAQGYQAMTQSVLGALDNTSSIPTEYHSALVEKAATATLENLSQVGLSANSVGTLIPQLVSTAVSALAGGQRSNDLQKNSMIMKFVSSALNRTGQLGLDTASVSLVHSNIVNKATTAINASGINSDLSTTIISGISTAIAEKEAESSTERKTDGDSSTSNP